MTCSNASHKIEGEKESCICVFMNLSRWIALITFSLAFCKQVIAQLWRILIKHHQQTHAHRYKKKKKKKFHSTFILTKYTVRNKIIFMSSLLTLPVELVYRILDNLNDRSLFTSVRNVCTRLDLIIDTYHRYRVSV